MLTVDCGRSMLPRKCVWCSKWIKPKTTFIAVTQTSELHPLEVHVFRYCSKSCVKRHIEEQQEREAKREELEREVLGDMW